MIKFITKKAKHFLTITLGSIIFISYTTKAEIDLDFRFPNKYTLERITIVGNKFTDADLIISVSGLEIGSTIMLPSSIISNAIQNIWDHGIVDNVNIYAQELSDNNVELIIEIVELPRLSTITFVGIDKKEEETLLEKLKLIVGKSISKDYVDYLKTIIKKHYIEEGYYSVQVSIPELKIDEKDNSAKIEILIDKGDEKIIGKILFIGNNVLEAGEIKANTIHTREKAKFTLIKNICKDIVTLKMFRKNGPLLRPFNSEELLQFYKNNVIFTSSNYDEKKFEEDKLQIINFYRSKGFRDAKILDTKFSTRKGDSSLNIKIYIYEGQQYKLGTINWIGNEIYSTKTLQRILKVSPESIYNPILIKERLSSMMLDDSVASLYYNNGYLAYGALAVESGVRDNIIDLEIRVREGHQFTLNKILLKGNKITHDNIILREITTLPGEKFNGAKFKRSYRELVMLNIFDPAKLEPIPIPDPVNKTTDILYKVKESPKFQLNLAGSYGGDGPQVGLNLTSNNASIGNIFKKRLPMGAKQDFVSEFKFNSKNSYNVSLKLLDPMISEKYPIGISGGIYWSVDRTYKSTIDDNKESSKNKDKDKDKDRDKDIASINKTLGTHITFIKKFPWIDFSSIKIGANYGWRQYDGNKLSLIEIKKEKPLNGTIHDISMDFTLSRNSTDHPIFPTTGSISSIQFTTTPPYSLFMKTPKIEDKPEITDFKFKEYHQTMLDFSLFIPLIGKLILNTRANAGILGGYQSKIGPFERFKMGGTADATNSNNNSALGAEFISLRGYEDGSICPIDSFSNYKGGVLYDKFAFELRYPIIDSSSIVHLSILTFFEAGKTWTKYKDFSILDIRRSAGFGMRLFVGMVLNTTIGLDFGYPFDKVGSGEKEMVAQFSMGVSLLR